MVSLTLSIPKEIHIKIKIHNEINWSGFIRNQITKKIKEIEAIDKLISQEKEITDFTLKLQKKSRKDRLKELKKKGLI
jgi:hypothetical protein